MSIGIGSQGNAWNLTQAGTTCGANGVSGGVDTGGLAYLSVFGHAFGATTLTVEVSQDNINYYDTSRTIVLTGAGDFALDFTTGARFARLKSSADINILATIAAKA